MNQDQVKTLIEDVAPLLDPERVVYREDQATWLFGFDETTIVAVIHDADQHRLVLQLELGSVPFDRQHSVYDLLLRYNFMWRESGGARMALDDEANVTFLFECPLFDLDAAQLQTIIGNFVHQGVQWFQLIQESSASETAATAPPQDAPQPPHWNGIRV
ncbi:MAG: type III secretion system chaperone [Candidatus Competibacteraceae bacterium]|nr:type III secretion system chaperone [Candidatus Competibacteraceae bacterium]